MMTDHRGAVVWEGGGEGGRGKGEGKGGSDSNERKRSFVTRIIDIAFIMCKYCKYNLRLDSL
jgi:hypothetical protein